GPVSDVIATTIDDDDPVLNVDAGADPGTDEVFTSPDVEITRAQVILRVSVTYTPAGATEHVILTGAIVSLTLPDGVHYYLLSDTGVGFPGLAAGIVATVGDQLGYQNDILYEDIACFAAGTLIDTVDGPRPVEKISLGDLVLTADHGPQPVRWIGRADLGPEALASRPELRPIRLRASCLGPGLPSDDLLLSPQHRLLLSGWRVELHLGEAEVLAPARQLLGWPGIGVARDCTQVSYFHLMFDRHEIVRANGLPAESFFFGDRMRDGLAEDQVQEILALFPELATVAPRPARPFTHAYEVAALGSATQTLRQAGESQ
ncbi:MAG: Hint domain-containing protein, partial [Paracoccaceae bacterium]|nr:Hint domain-containing protein [Paracoccaceae bacterium]